MTTAVRRSVAFLKPNTHSKITTVAVALVEPAADVIPVAAVLASTASALVVDVAVEACSVSFSSITKGTAADVQMVVA